MHVRQRSRKDVQVSERTLLDELCLLQTFLDPLRVRADIRPEALVQPLSEPIVGVWILPAQVVELCEDDEVKVGRQMMRGRTSLYSLRAWKRSCCKDDSLDGVLDAVEQAEA